MCIRDRLSVRYLHLESFRGEGADKVKLGGRLRDADKSAAARDARAEFTDVDVTLRVSLRQSEEGLVKSRCV